MIRQYIFTKQSPEVYLPDRAVVNYAIFKKIFSTDLSLLEVFTFAQNNSKNFENIDSGHIGQSSERIDFYFFAILHKTIWR
jgi:hypothetical protein